MSAVEQLIGALGEVCAGLADQRKGARRDGDYTMADMGRSAFSIFFMGSPSLLAHQRALEEGLGRSNCATVSAMSALPSDNYVRLMLHGAPTAAFDGLFMQAIEAAGPQAGPATAAGVHRTAERGREAGLRRQRRATLAGPARHWPRRSSAGLSWRDRFACQPIVAAIQEAAANFIRTCKSTSHRTVAAYLHGAELQEHRDTVCKRGKRTTTVHRWLSAVPLRATDDAITVNWFSIEILNAKGKQTAHNGCVTDLAITSSTVAELAACRRARSKIETFNVLKTNRYNLEHNFGHGKKTLASVRVSLNLLAFAFHTAAFPGILAWRTAGIARGPTYRFFADLRTITVYGLFEDATHLLASIAAAALRPP